MPNQDRAPAIASDFVEVVLFRRKGRSVTFLLLKRSESERPYPGIWQVISGRRNGGEEASRTAVREVREETGIDPSGLWTLPFVNTFYAAPEDRIHMVPTFAAEAHHGSRVVLSPEHSASRWVTRTQAERLVQWPAHLTMMDLVTEYICRARGSVHRIPLH